MMAADQMTANVSEVFCSVQGEGPYVGSRQAFVRFTGCNLKCSYCDTPVESSNSCRFEELPGSGVFKLVENPLSAEDIGMMVSSYRHIHSVSLTGGEPLMHADLISRLNITSPLYLESNMTLPHMAKKIRDKLSYVAGDVKLLPLSSIDDVDQHFDRTIECFRTLKTTKDRECFCKVVVTKDTDADDVEGMIGAIAGYVSCVVLQPVSQKELLPAPGYLIGLQERLLDQVDTKIIPQTHRMWGCL
jgi:organic radical activating enzyme